MGPQFPIAFPDSLRATAKACFRSLPALAAGLFVSCISDGPNRTGGAYLDEHGIVLENPLYKVRIEGFPVDSFWTTESAPSHLNDTILLLGRKGGFTAETRLSYHVSDTSFLDSLSDSASLRLSLSTPTWKNVGIWKDNGDSALRLLADPGVAAESLTVAVLAWDSDDSGLAAAAWNDSLARRNRRYLINGDTLAVLPAPTSIDTIRLKVAGAYSERGQLQDRALPRLKETLEKSKSRKHSVQLRLIPVPAAGPADSLPAMLRLGGEWDYDDARKPLLLFGRDLPADSLGSKNRLLPMNVGSGISGVTYTLRYSGPRDGLVVPLQRGLHIAFDRDRLLDSVNAALFRQDSVPRTRPTDSLSLAYFVPFAAITLPIDSPSLEAGLPVQVRLLSAVDSLLGDTAEAGTRVDRIPLGESLAGWSSSELGHPETMRNRITLHYDSIGTLRRVILALSKDSAFNDTVFLPVGGTSQIVTALATGNKRTLQISVEAGQDTLIARSYVSLRVADEPNGFRDPATGKSISLDSQVTRFVRPGDGGIRLRATGGLRALLNRASLDSRARQEFEFRPVWQAYNPMAVPATGDPRASQVQFPVLSVIPPRIQAGALTVDLELYLYPLGAR